MMRSNEPGWIRVAATDCSGRRAVWVRIADRAIEFCAGREGDDAYAKLMLDGSTTYNDLIALEDVVSRGLDVLEDTSDE